MAEKEAKPAKVKKPTEWIRFPEGESLAATLIRKYHPHLKEAVIICVAKPKASRDGKWVNVAKASKASRIVRALVTPKPNYIVTVGLDSWNTHDQRERSIVMDHELCHFAGKNEKGKWKLRRHDIEEFMVIFKRYGAWTPELQRIVELTRSVKERRVA